MRKYLYDDFYEGLLHILLLFPPVIAGIISLTGGASTNTVCVSLLISILGSFYSARNFYKNKAYSDNRRVKIELIITLVLLAISLCWALFVLQLNLRDESNSATEAQIEQTINSTVNIENQSEEDNETQSLKSIVAAFVNRPMFKDSTVPLITYSFSLLPYIFETISVMLSEVKCCSNKIKRKRSTLFPEFFYEFDVTTGNIN